MKNIKSLLIFMVLALAVSLVCLAPADELRTVMGSYRTIHTTVGTATETSPATTDFAINSSDQDAAFDLMSLGFAGPTTSANAPVINVFATATDGDVCVIEYWGIADNGPLELICSVSYIFGTAVRSTGVLWADIGVVTDSHTSTVKSGGKGVNDVNRTLLDLTGFRKLRSYVVSRTGATNINVMARFF